jgi:hypothetical protein
MVYVKRHQRDFRALQKYLCFRQQLLILNKARSTRMQRTCWRKLTRPPTTPNRESEFHGSLEVGVPKIFKSHSVFLTLSFSVPSKITMRLWIPHVSSDSERNPICFVSRSFCRLAHLDNFIFKFDLTTEWHSSFLCFKSRDEVCWILLTAQLHERNQIAKWLTLRVTYKKHSTTPREIRAGAGFSPAYENKSSSSSSHLLYNSMFVTCSLFNSHCSNYWSVERRIQWDC